MKSLPPRTPLFEAVLASPITAVPHVFVDVETTGLSYGGEDRVCEIALVRREPGGSIYEWSQLIDPQRAISRGAFSVNRISAAMLKGQPNFSALIPEINEIVDGAVWIAHNAPFDLGFLRAEYRRARRTFVERPCIDTCHLARRHFRFESNNLGALATEFGHVNPQAHRALGDCRTTMHIFEAMRRSVFVDRIPTVAELSVHPDRMKLSGDSRRVIPRSLGDLLKKTTDIDIVYLSGEGQRSARRITVLEVIPQSNDLYVVAHCHLRDDQRSFRLDRILEWRATEGTESNA